MTNQSISTIFTKHKLITVEKDFEKGQESVYSNKVRAGRRRTYFFDVRRTKGDDYYVTLTESTRKFNSDGYTRHKIFLYKEDFNRFMEGLQDAISHVKNDLMPDYDYEQFDRKQEEWERSKAEEANAAPTDTPTDTSSSNDTPKDGAPIDDDMVW